MQKLTEVKRRIRTVTAIGSVTRTMATVASAKLSRTRERAAGVRVYTEETRRVLQRQQAYAAAMELDLAALSPFLVERAPVRSILMLHISGDRGMCGAYNSAVDREAADFISRQEAGGCRTSVIAKGSKGAVYLRRKAGADVIAEETWSRAGVTAEEVDAYVERLSSSFLSGECDEVWCAYTRFFTPLRREPRVIRLLPIVFEDAPEPGPGDSPGNAGDPRARAGVADIPGLWSYEPDLGSIVKELLAVLLRLQIEDVLLESFASEQGARMITMEEATERADRTLAELTVAFNRLRREVITTDLIGVLFASRLREDESETPEVAKR